VKLFEPIRQAFFDWWWRRQLDAIFDGVPSFRVGDEIRPGVWLHPDGSERPYPPEKTA
jgi:hypothetical protein